MTHILNPLVGRIFLLMYPRAMKYFLKIHFLRFPFLLKKIGVFWRLAPALGSLSLHGDLTRLGDLDFSVGLVLAVGLGGLDLAHQLQRVVAQDLAEDNVLAVEPWRGDGGDEELRSVGVLAGVGHRQLSRLRVLEFEVLVREL